MNIPEICTKQEEQALLFIESRTHKLEPVCILGVRGLGKNVLMNNTNLSYLEKRGYQVKKIIAHDENELNLLLADLEWIPFRPTVLLVSLSTNTDAAFFLKRLTALREKYGVKFVSIVLADFKSGLGSYLNNEKILTRSLYIIKPLNLSDTELLVKNLGKRFEAKLTDEEIDRIFTLSGGHVGLIKALVLLKKDSGTVPGNEGEILENENIATRLKDIFLDLPEQIRKKLVTGSDLTKDEVKFLEKFGLTKDGRLLSKLLSNYLQTESQSESTDISLELTSQELDVLNYLKDRLNVVVDREQLAEVIWKEEWDEKYSDWALDQLIYRLRNKLKKSNAPYKLVTKKGQGFYLKKL